MELDEWTITDADTVWNFRVQVFRDENDKRPEAHADVYDAELMQKTGDADPKLKKGDVDKAVDWARRAVWSWENDDWQFAVLAVTPVHRATGALFDGQTETLSGVEYGWLPGAGPEDKGTWTTDVDYIRETWLGDMIDTARKNAIEALVKLTSVN